MQLSSDLRERLIRTASGAGVALALALVALASPTPAVAGAVRSGPEYGESGFSTTCPGGAIHKASGIPVDCL
ncbi:MAG: hypothetical protein E2602_08350 [Achromobacter sp.]|uniref:Uncharacterized protein n=1 Tax=Achromobacter pulmonis TaxID=1389932 RepID=A0A6S7DQL8_9BURK|nr:hypothetical protein [Achromobacter pulmonis]MCF7767716.1 hypothetical protein [Achromobacter pulmonis]MPT26908.1 hypothetical protein [Achromobacter sp.]CAB3644795.1 hypothetical protein LMG26696_02391 [Achromobacter pulmonis]CAB3875894.1 hypothetical protein LMG26788_03029 [Achromobacter pulmonis]